MWNRHWLKLTGQRARRLLSECVYKPVARIYYHFAYKHVAPVDKVIYINRSDITAWYRGNRYNEFTFKGEIYGGDWFRKLTPKEIMLKQSIKFRSVIQRYEEGKPWRETELVKIRYADEKNLLNDGKVESDLDKLEQYHEDRYDEIFRSIQKHGMVGKSDGDRSFEPIHVMIGAEGEIYYTVDGNHRFAMCEVLGIEEMPVQVWKRHTRWQKLREEILSGNIRNINCEKYLNHPDIVSENCNNQEF
jgi:hypothetical protein